MDDDELIDNYDDDSADKGGGKIMDWTLTRESRDRCWLFWIADGDHNDGDGDDSD